MAEKFLKYKGFGSLVSNIILLCWRDFFVLVAFLDIFLYFQLVLYTDDKIFKNIGGLACFGLLYRI